MSGAKSIQVLMNRMLMQETMPLDKAEALWVEVKARLSKTGSKPTITEVEACLSGNLDTHPRDIVRNAVAFVLVGSEYWQDHYAGSTFLFRFLKECIARGYIESDGSLGDAPPVKFKMMVSDGVETFHQTVVHAKDYDNLEAELIDLRRQLAELKARAGD